MVGAGQLARMTLQAAVDLDVRLEVLAESPNDSAVRAGARHRIGQPDDLAALRDLAGSSDVLTLDHEHVPTELLETLAAEGCAIRPGARAVLLASDKVHARREMQAEGFPVPIWAEATSADDVAAMAERTGWPVVLKARGGGYDGKGVHMVESRDAAEAIMEGGEGWLIEECVAIDVEIAVLVARRPSGEVAVYPVIETRQVDGICHELVMPADIPETTESRARELAVELISWADVAGIAAVEMFLTEAGELLIGEIAVRPHNSGHATIEGSVTSQFENHLRGVLDWPLGSVEPTAPSVAMVNLLGVADCSTSTRLPRALAVPGASVHLYGKEERPGRKIGHVTATGPTREQALETARRAAGELTGTGQ